MPTKNQIEVKKYFNSTNKKKLNSWEKKFISSLYKSKKDWSEKQLEVFNKIIEKYQFKQKQVIERIIILADGYADGSSQKFTTKRQRRLRAIGKKIK
jgi:hypothetical protein